MEVATVNMPEYWLARKNLEEFKGTPPYELVNKVKSFDKKSNKCKSWVYAAYLPAGSHQFLIWDPILKKLFIKDVIIDLAQTESYPEFPKMPRKPQSIVPNKKKTFVNMWRKFREDGPLDVEMALINDMCEESWQPSLFIKDEDDVELCKDILKSWFHRIKIVHMENMAASFTTTYPEQQVDVFMKSILNQ